MKNIKTSAILFVVFLLIENITFAQTNNNTYNFIKMEKTDKDWKKELTEEEYKVLREKATEAPFTGEYNLHFEEGIYTCGGCGTELFSSEGKFDAGCGWPSFIEPINSNVIETKTDTSFGRTRTEMLCKNCGGHLGHVFNDGPVETGLRYCVNSLSLDFKKTEE